MGTDWVVDTVSDLDGGLQMDIALKNTTTGQLYIYNIENGAISGGANLGDFGTD